MTDTGRILVGDVRERLRELEDGSVHCVVTSPPYWGLRDYGVAGQLGLEATPQDHVAAMVDVFGEVRRVLRDDGTCWVNYGDSYITHPHGPAQANAHDPKWAGARESGRTQAGQANRTRVPGLKHKDMAGVPWRFALAMQDDGWHLRSDIIWAKPNPMPESVTDRPAKSHEHIFLLTKSATYFYDAEAVKEPVSGTAKPRGHGVNPKAASNTTGAKQNTSFSSAVRDLVDARNLRDVWMVATHPFPGAHFATFPPDLIRPCIRAGCPAGGTVLDPLFGAGTTGLVCDEEGRDWIGIELNPEYAEIARRRLEEKQELLPMPEPAP